MVLRVVAAAVAALAVVAVVVTRGGDEHDAQPLGHDGGQGAHGDHGDRGDRAAGHEGGDEHDGHGTFGPVDEEPLTDAEERALDEQWARAAAATGPLATVADADAAGYRQASAQAPGIGTHWIRWDLVDLPFDPARPSMLLYDRSRRGGDRLAGFSYWVRSPTAPEGFAGPNDHWHQHHGLCFVDGWLDREGVPAAQECPGEWHHGGDLWMLHAWVVPGMENRWGRFAPRHAALCPPPGGMPDVLTCSPLRN